LALSSGRNVSQASSEEEAEAGRVFLGNVGERLPDYRAAHPNVFNCLTPDRGTGYPKVFRSFPQPLRKMEDITSNRPRSRPSKSLPVHHSPYKLS
jgi:hypothetical protein